MSSSFHASHTLAFVSHLPATVCAFLATSDDKMNCSIVPSIASDNDQLWTALSSSPAVKILSEFSHTMQFTGSLMFSQDILKMSKTPNNDVISTPILTNLLQGGRYFLRSLKHISLSTSNQISLICGATVALHSIELSECEVTDADLQLISRCTLLKELCLKEEVVPRHYGYGAAPATTAVHITDTGIQHISNLESLEVLKLVDLASITRLQCLRQLKNLHTLDLHGSTSLADASFQDNDGFVFDTTGKKDHSSKITFVSVEGCRRLTSAGFFDKLLQHLTALATLECTDLATLTVNSPSLRALDIKCTSKEADLTCVSAHFPNLETLRATITHNTSDYYSYSRKKDKQKDVLVDLSPALQGMAQNLAHLHTLHFQGDCRGLDDNALLALSHATSPIRSLTIDLDPIKASADECFTNEGFAHLTALLSLEKLEIKGNINKKFNGNLGKNNAFSPNLTQVSLKGLKCLNATGLRSILHGLPLRSLDVEIPSCGGKSLNSNDVNKALPAACSQTLERLRLFNFKFDNLDFLQPFGNVSPSPLKYLSLASSQLKCRSRKQDMWIAEQIDDMVDPHGEFLEGPTDPDKTDLREAADELHDLFYEMQEEQGLDIIHDNILRPVRRLTNLIELDLSRTNINSPNCVYYLDTLTSLKKLLLNQNESLTDRTVRMISEKMRDNLEELNICQPYGCGSRTQVNITTNAVLDMIKKLPRLKHLFTNSDHEIEELFKNDKELMTKYGHLFDKKKESLKKRSG